jgi:hypothetical protein
MHLPSYIKPDSADAFNYAYTMLYCKQPKDIRLLIDRSKTDEKFICREIDIFLEEVVRIAQYTPSQEDFFKWQIDEKARGVHPSQIKTIEHPKEITPPCSGENPS